MSELDMVIHQPARLKIMSALMGLIWRVKKFFGKNAK